MPNSTCIISYNPHSHQPTGQELLSPWADEETEAQRIKSITRGHKGSQWQGLVCALHSCSLYVHCINYKSVPILFVRVGSGVGEYAECPAVETGSMSYVHPQEHYATMKSDAIEKICE